MGITRHPLRAFLVLSLFIICTGCQPVESSPAASEEAPAILLATATPENTPTQTLLSTLSTAPNLATSTPVPARATSTLFPYQPGPAIAPMAAGQSIQLVDLFMADATTGWAVEFTGHIVRTTDGGSTWKDVTPPDGAFTPDGFFMQDGQTAWAARDVPPECWETTEIITCPVDYYPLSDSAVVWKTINGGETWTASDPIRLDDGDAPYTQDGRLAFSPVMLQFIDDRTGWLLAALGMGRAGEYSRLYRSEDAGATWSPVSEFGQDTSAYSCRKLGAAFTDAETAWMLLECAEDQPAFQMMGEFLVPGFSEGHAVVKTSDGGLTWSQPQIAIPDPPPLPESYGKEGFAVTFLAVRDDEWKVRWQRYPDRSIGVHLHNTNEFFFRLRAGVPEVVVEVPGRYFWLEWAKEVCVPDGGCGHQYIGESGVSSFESEYFLDARRGWRLMWDYVRKQSALECTEDGGATWTSLREVAWNWATFRFIDGQTGWGLVQNTQKDWALVRTTDGGRAWTWLHPVIR